MPKDLNLGKIEKRTEEPIGNKAHTIYGNKEVPSIVKSSKERKRKCESKRSEPIQKKTSSFPQW